MASIPEGLSIMYCAYSLSVRCRITTKHEQQCIALEVALFNYLDLKDNGIVAGRL